MSKAGTDEKCFQARALPRAPGNNESASWRLMGFRERGGGGVEKVGKMVKGVRWAR